MSLQTCSTPIPHLLRPVQRVRPPCRASPRATTSRSSTCTRRFRTWAEGEAGALGCVDALICGCVARAVAALQGTCGAPVHSAVRPTAPDACTCLRRYTKNGPASLLGGPIELVSLLRGPIEFVSLLGGSH
eukprot:366453-Chlamydomonas_euryale.AAC.6